MVTYGDTTPNGVFTLSSNKAYSKPNSQIDITANVYNPSYIADGVWIDSTASSGMSLLSSTTTLKDGAVADLKDNSTGGYDVLLGDIVHGQSRAVKWGVSWASEGVKTFYAALESDNMDYEQTNVQVTVDGTAPGTPGNVHSTTHSVNGHSCEDTVTMTWNPASDALAGVAGYALSWTQSSGSDPGTTVGTAGTSFSTNLPPSAAAYWFHVRAVDKAGNAGSIVHVGPFWIGQGMGSPYCAGNPNSTTQVAVLEATGQICLADKELSLHAYDAPKSQFGHFMMSQTQAFVPFFGGSDGNLCIGAPIYRFSKYILNTGSGGEVTFQVPFTNLPSGAVIGHGSTWNFQFWFRDKTTKLTSNTTNGLMVQFD